jgi:hypothetical protein
MSTKYSIVQVAELFFRKVFRLHGLLKNIVSDRDSWLIGTFWRKFFQLVGTELTPSTSYHPQIDGQTEIVNKWVEGYLRIYVSGQHRKWVRWLHLGEHCYNTNFRMSIGMTPFQALYGYDAPTLVDFIFGERRSPKAKDCITESQEILKVLKENMQTTQNRQKMSADKHMIERKFEVGDLVFLRLQPYRQSSLNKSGVEKLKPRFNGPYRIMRRVGEVAYEIEFPKGNQIHNMFHGSCLKKAVGQFINTSEELPPLDEEGQLELVLEEVLEF